MNQFLLVVLLISQVALFSGAAQGQEISKYLENAPRFSQIVSVNHPSQYPERDIRSRWPYLPAYQGKAEANPNPHYIVQPNDVIELFFESTVLDTPKMILSIRFPGDPAIGTALITNVRRPKFPAGLLTIKKAGNRVERFVLRVQPIGQTEFNPTSITIPGDTWESIQTKLQSISIDGRAIKARLIPALAERAAPGDSIRLYRMQMDANGLQKTDEFNLQVDSDGYIWIPPQTSGLTTPGDALAVKVPFLRGLNSAVDSAYFRVRVVHPNKTATEQPTLSELSQRLSSLSKEFDQAALDDWLSGEIDEQFLAKDTEASGLRYHMSIVTERKWYLVDESGHRETFKHHGRELLIEAVRTKYRTLTGNELLDGLKGSRSQAYLTVIPEQSTSKAFFGRLDSGDPHSQLRGLSLEPGDTIIVSRSTPAEAKTSHP